MVAGRKGLGKDTCNGDSGGPAYLRQAGGYVVAGLTSRATRSAAVNCGDGGIYVRPSAFRDWINGVLAEAGLPALP
jgi:endonuclease G